MTSPDIPQASRWLCAAGRKISCLLPDRQAGSLNEWAFAALLAAVFSVTFSIALGQTCAAVCLGVFIVGIVKGQLRWSFPRLMIPAVAFICLAVVLSGVQGGVHGLWARTGKLAWFILIPVVASLVAAPDRDRKLIMAFLSGCAVLGVKDLVWYPLAAWKKPVPDFFTALVDKGSMTDGQMLMLGTVGSVLFLLMAIKEGRRTPWWGWVILAAQVAGLVINFKRGSWFCAIVLIGIAILMTLRWRAWVLAVAVLVGFLLLPPVQARMGQLKKEFNVEGGGRLTMWMKIAPALIQEQPGGLGYGCLTNERMKQVYRRVEPNRNHLHANWAQVLVETGWLGLLVYLVWMGKALWDGASRVRGTTGMVNRGPPRVVFALLVGLLLNGLVEYNFGDTELMIVYAFVMGLIGAKETLNHPLR